LNQLDQNEINSSQKILKPQPMSANLYNIMVPVDFTGKNKWAIAKAIELANTFHCNIHLVHVLHKPVIPFIPVDKSKFTPYESTAELHVARKKTRNLKNFI